MLSSWSIGLSTQVTTVSHVLGSLSSSIRFQPVSLRTLRNSLPLLSTIATGTLRSSAPILLVVFLPIESHLDSHSVPLNVLFIGYRGLNPGDLRRNISIIMNSSTTLKATTCDAGCRIGESGPPSLGCILIWVAARSIERRSCFHWVLPEILGWRDSILLRPLYGTRHGCPSTKNVPPAKDTWVPSGRIPPLASLLETLSSILCVLQCNIASISSSDSSHFGGSPKVHSDFSFMQGKGSGLFVEPKARSLLHIC